MPLLLNIPGVEGKTQFEGYEKCLSLSSVSWNARRNVAFGTSGSYHSAGVASAPIFSEVTVTRPSDSMTAALWTKSVGNQTFTAKLHWLRVSSGGKADKYMEVVLTDARIIRLSDISGGDRPIETVALSFAEIEWLYINHAHSLSGVQASASYKLPN